MKMIRINDEINQSLDNLAQESGETKQELLKKAVELLIREHFFLKADKAYKTLKSNPKQWAAELSERKLWEATSQDGLMDDDYDY